MANLLTILSLPEVDILFTIEATLSDSDHVAYRLFGAGSIIQSLGQYRSPSFDDVMAANEYSSMFVDPISAATTTQCSVYSRLVFAHDPAPVEPEQLLCPPGVSSELLATPEARSGCNRGLKPVAVIAEVAVRWVGMFKLEGEAASDHWGQYQLPASIRLAKSIVGRLAESDL